MSEIDKVARELLAAEYERDGRLGMGALIREPYRLADDDDRSFRAIRAALLTAPPGWKLVPVQPTREMIKAVYPYHSMFFEGEFLANWDKSISAAPEPKA